MDQDKSGKIDFVEFVAAIFNYCTHTWQGLCKYAFDLFDEDGSGFLDVNEVGFHRPPSARLAQKSSTQPRDFSLAFR